jgi:hypothetical protein
LNDTTTGVGGIVVRAEPDVVEAAHADLNSVLDLADIVGPAVGAGDRQKGDSDPIRDFDL